MVKEMGMGVRNTDDMKQKQHYPMLPPFNTSIYRTHPFPSHNQPSDEALGLVWWINFFCDIHKKRNNSIMKHKIITFISQQTSQVYVQGVERSLMIFTSILNNMVLLMSCIFLSLKDFIENIGIEVQFSFLCLIEI